MDRWACVDAFSFSLQVLLSLQPEWSDYPVAVVERTHPRGRLLELNKRAQDAHLKQGMRYGEALALVPHLRVDCVDDERLADKSDAVAATLSDFSPRVEVDEAKPGLFWLDVSGVEPLFSSWEQWVTELRDCLRKTHDVYVAVVIGHSRFGTFAIAHSTRKSGVFATAQSERDAAGKVPLEDLDLPASALQTTDRLGIKTIDELLALPSEGLRRRLGDQVFALYRRARGDLRTPRPAFATDNAPTQQDHLDYAETDANRLLFLIKSHLHGLLESLDHTGEKLALLRLSLHRRQRAPIESDIRLATPTLDPMIVVDLVRLHLEKLPISEGITDVMLTAHGEQTTTEQMHLFAGDRRRDIQAANRSLARVRAEFGADAVVQVSLKAGHLPESRFKLVRLETLDLPDVETGSSGASGPAVRRFFPTPITVEKRPDIAIRAGPHTISGGWWVRQAHRDYHLIELHGRRLLWIFYDHHRKRWYIHGEF